MEHNVLYNKNIYIYKIHVLTLYLQLRESKTSQLAAVGINKSHFQFSGEGTQEFTAVTRKWATANMQFDCKRFNTVVNCHCNKIPPQLIVLLKIGLCFKATTSHLIPW